MKTVWRLDQFFYQNEPKFWGTVGNISFLLGLVAGIPLFASQFAIVVPAVIVGYSTKAALALVGIKWFTKNFGKVDENGKTVKVLPPPPVEIKTDPWPDQPTK